MSSAETNARNNMAGFTNPDDLQAQRNLMVQLEESGFQDLGPVPEGIKEYWTTITLPDGWESKTLVVRPQEGSSADKKPPLIVLFHGGGYVVGSPKLLVRPARDFAEKYGAVVICPSYKLSPENPWPAPMVSGWGVVEYLAKTAEVEYGVSLSGPSGGFILGGFSAGAGVSAVVAGIATYGHLSGESQQKLARPLTGLFLGIPHLLAKDIVPEQYENEWTAMEENKGVVADGMRVALGYLNCKDYKSPWFSPVNHFVSGDNNSIASKHPPTYVQVGRLDPLRDDGVIYEKVLSKHGVVTRIDVFPEDGHVAWNTIPIPTKSTNPTVEEATLKGMEWLLFSQA